MPTRGILKPQPLRDVTELDGPGGWWHATGAACSFRLLPGQAGLPIGWTHVTIPLQAPGKAPKVPGFKADCGNGYQPLRTLLQRRSADGCWTVVIHVPQDTAALSMSLPIAAGPFRLGPVAAVRTTRQAVGARLALSLGRRWLREPRQLLRSARGLHAAWRTDGREGLRSAVGFTMLGDEPVGTPIAVSPAERYRQWIAEHEGDVRLPMAGAGLARFSVLIPMPAGDAERLFATLQALRAQQGADWECLIGLGPDADMKTVAAVVEPLAGAPISRLALPDGERGAMLAALAAGASGDLLLVLDPGDRLVPEALAALASASSASTVPGIIHGDEDRAGADGRRDAPFLKPEWSPELLHAFNYFGRPVALRRALAEQAGGFTPGLGAGAEWDLHLRLAAAAVTVARVPGILCQRHHAGAADRPPSGQLAAAQHRAVLAAYWQRQGIAATVTTQADGTQRSTWPIDDAPLVSIVIPARDRPALLHACLRGIRDGTRYPRIQVLVVDSGSTDPAMLALYAREQAAGHIEVVAFLEPFNHAGACNAGARAARGELLLFLHDGIEIMAEDWLEELVRFAQHPGVGVVGTMLLDPDGTLQHAGAAIGLPFCGPLFRGAPEAEWGPIGSSMVPRTVSAVAGACQMVRRDVFARVGGFDETYITANSDVALCLGARAAGWRIAYTPFARLVHHAGASRGPHDPTEDLTRIAIDIRRFGYDRDPFLHPALDAGSSIPRLRIGAEPGNGTSLLQELHRHGVGLANPLPLDLGHDMDVAEAVGMPVSAVFWPPPLPAAIEDQWSAARWCLDLLRRRPDLRARFPHALSGGASGTFAEWLAGPAAGCFALPPAAVRHVQAALAAGISARTRQVALTETRLAGKMALAFLPPGRAALLGFLLRRDGTPLRLEEIWWLALECAEDPARELALSYRFNPGWQALFPDGLTVFGQQRFAAWLRAICRCDAAWTQPAGWPQALTPAQQIRLGWYAREHWQRHHPSPFASEPAARRLLDWLGQPEAGLENGARDWVAAQPAAALAAAVVAPGVNLIGHFCYPSGLRTSAFSVVRGLRAVPVEVSLRNVPVDGEHDLPRHVAYDGLEEHAATLLHIQPEPFFGQAFDRAGLHPRRQRSHRIGYWYWELEAVPESWAGAVAEADELWAATRFVGDALRSRFSIPVFNLMPGVELSPFTQRSPDQFGIPAGRFTFLFVFHMMSIMERKNPLGLIRAFRMAFSAADPVTLVLKTSFGDKHPDLIGRLHASANEAGAEVLVIDRVFTTEETISLMDACNAYVSLHRSEGFGLTMAEAMLLGKPVVATAYSGNLDFMDDSNSLLADYKLVAIDKPTPPYRRGSLWAEPSEAHAARLMRQIWESPDLAATLGSRARSHVTTNLAMAAAGRRMAARLAVIRAQQSGSHHARGPALPQVDRRCDRLARAPSEPSRLEL